MIIDENDFEFDCPKTVVDTSKVLTSHSTIDTWFFLPHPKHKESSVPSVKVEDCEDPLPPSVKTLSRKHQMNPSIALTSRCEGREGSKKQKINRDTSSVTKSTASSASRRKAVESSLKTKDVIKAPVSIKPKPPTKALTHSSPKKTQTSAKKNMKPSQHAENLQKELGTGEGIATGREERVQKVSVTMKSFPSSKPVPTQAAVTRSDKLEEYKRQKNMTMLQKQQAHSQSQPSQKKKRTNGVAEATTTGAKTRGNKSQNDNGGDDDAAMLVLLKQHNKKFQPVSLYEPSRHSVRDVRRWERQEGRTWASLAPEEREQANADILRLKQAGS